MQLPPGMSALLQLNVAGTALNIAPRRCAADRPFGRIDERSPYRQTGVIEEKSVPRGTPATSAGCHSAAIVGKCFDTDVDQATCCSEKGHRRYLEMMI